MAWSKLYQVSAGRNWLWHTNLSELHFLQLKCTGIIRLHKQKCVKDTKCRLNVCRLIHCPYWLGKCLVNFRGKSETDRRKALAGSNLSLAFYPHERRGLSYAIS